MLVVQSFHKFLRGGFLDRPRRAHTDIGGERTRLREQLLIVHIAAGQKTTKGKAQKDPVGELKETAGS